MAMYAFLILVSFLHLRAGASPLELTDKDFDSRVKGKMALVMFYSPTCGHCIRVKPTIEKVSKDKAVIGSGTIVAKVDCTGDGKALCGRYGVRGFPTIKFISRVDKTETTEDYQGDRSYDDFVKFVLENSQPTIKEVSASEADDFVESTTKPVVFGLFKDKKSKLYKKLVFLAPQFKKFYIFGVSFDKKAAEEVKGDMDSVKLFRQQHYKTPAEPFTLVETKDSKLEDFLTKNRFSLVEIRDPKNEEEFDKPLIVAYLPIHHHLQKMLFRRIRNILIALAKQDTNTKFAISLTSSYTSLVSEFNEGKPEDTVFLMGYDKDDNKFLCQDSASVDDLPVLTKVLTKFYEDFKKGGILEKYIKSQPATTPDDGDVKVVVASTFEKIVLDDTKDVLIEFYAPWCGHCKKLEPIYRELATALKDEQHLVIAKMDATANEVHKDFNVEGFPTLYLAKAGQKSKPVAFDGKRDLAGMIEWLKKNVKHPIKYDAAVPEDKSEL